MHIGDYALVWTKEQEMGEYAFPNLFVTSNFQYWCKCMNSCCARPKHPGKTDYQKYQQYQQNHEYQKYHEATKVKLAKVVKLELL